MTSAAPVVDPNNALKAEDAPRPLLFKEISKAKDAGHTLSITIDGVPYSRCHNPKSCTNELGQLGRTGNPSTLLPIEMSAMVAGASHVYAGGFGASGHTAILDESGELWLCGCDRWQQLGLGSPQGGSSGYTWAGGKLWQDRLQKNLHVVELIKNLDPSLLAASSSTTRKTTGEQSRRWIKDVALGGDHTVVLSANGKDVITFGRGAEDQLGLSSKPFVSAPTKAKALSSNTASISAVCAYRNCSMTLDAGGGVMSTAGKCSLELQGMKRALDLCQKRAQETGLMNNHRKPK